MATNILTNLDDAVLCGKIMFNFVRIMIELGSY